MSTPVLHLLAGPNGAGKSTFHEHVLAPLGLRFVNADVIAREAWPGEEMTKAYEAAQIAADARARLIREGTSFVAETVFSHPSKLELIEQAQGHGFHVTLHIVMVPVEESVLRVEARVKLGGHGVPEDKVRARYGRLVELPAVASRRADVAHLYDNSSSKHAFRRVATWRNGTCVWIDDVPAWMPEPLRY